jgi:hypothetical protein
VETKASSEQALILKRDPDAVQSEHHDVPLKDDDIAKPIGARGFTVICKA